LGHEAAHFKERGNAPAATFGLQGSEEDGGDMTQPLIKFGTDGWRGVIADDFTFANVRACADGLARHLTSAGGAVNGVVTGYDTRFLSDAFARAAAEVLAGHGIPVILSDAPVPTPVISWTVAHRRAAMGVAITASHNPKEWNGFKCRATYGGSPPQDVLDAIERAINNPPAPAASGAAMGHRQAAIAAEDLKRPYQEHLNALVDSKLIQNARRKVAVDAMHGAGAGYLPDLVRGKDGTSFALEIRAERNPLFPRMHNPEPIERNLEPVAGVVRDIGAAVGLAFDGDADRLGVLDERGQYVSSLHVGALLAYHLLEHRKQRGLLVKSLTSSAMLWRLGERYGVPVKETGVGFKFISPHLVEAGDKALMGIEESGGYAYCRHIPERDGIVSGLLFLELMAVTGKKPSELVQTLETVVGPHRYDRLDIHFPPDQRSAIQQRVAAAEPGRLASLRVEGKDTPDGTRFKLEGGAWLIVRFSGTEPLLRIYAEADSHDRVRSLLEAGKALAGL
jgi:phosphomannomutase